MGDGDVKSLDTLDDFNGALSNATSEDKPFFVKFTAKWCSPCKRIKIEYLEQAKVHSKSALFYMVCSQSYFILLACWLMSHCYLYVIVYCLFIAPVVIKSLHPTSMCINY